jgi:hypothetical protein
MITKFETYIKEGIVNKMTPISEEDIISTILKDTMLVSDINGYVSEISEPIKDFLISKGINNINDYKIIDFKYDTESYDIFDIFERITLNSKNISNEDMGEFEFVYFKDVDIVYLMDDSGEINFMITTIDNLKEQLAKLSL